MECVGELAPLHTSNAWRTNLCSLTRVFLRFLRWEGILGVDLDRAVPKLPYWRLSTIPRHLSWNQVRDLIDSVDTSKRGGLRDRPVLLLLATLGLRRKEVCELHIHDIAWRADEIRLRRTKTRRERALPLTEEVGAALAEYVLRYKAGVDVQAMLPALATYMGHVCYSDTAYYLTATAELLELAAERAQKTQLHRGASR